MQLISVLPQTINICYSPPGRSILGKTVPEVLILKTEGTVCPNMDWPRMLNDILINKKSFPFVSRCSHVWCRLQRFEAMRSTGHAWSYKAWCSAVINCLSTALIGAFWSLLFCHFRACLQLHRTQATLEQSKVYWSWPLLLRAQGQRGNSYKTSL